MAAPNFVDLIWPLFLLAGLERVRIDPGNTAFTPLAFDYYPWTHSLLMGVVWGAVLGLAARFRGLSRHAAALVGVLVVSHWFLDLVTHRADLPLSPWSSRTFGLGLWHSIPATLAVEGSLWIAGIVVFLRVYHARGVRGQVAFWSFVITSTLIWVSGPFVAPPPDVHTLALSAAIGWIIVPWAWWIERTTMAR
jgi:membrane-bound metal-dependent hydrolase YbcI (DUF457 family)